ALPVEALLQLLLGLAVPLRGDVADAHVDEPGARLPGHAAGEQGLAGARRSEEEGAAGGAGAPLVVGVGVLEGEADRLQLALRLLLASDVTEGDGVGLVLLLVDAAGALRLAAVGQAAAEAGDARER